MIIIPLSTDAPIYHWPWMTLLLIALNVLVFVITGHGENSEGWILQYGNGLHPAEWFACNFLHFGWIHLIGNMIFLWAFGIIVEGKLGWWRFLLLYLLIGGLGGFIEQAVMLGFEGEGPTGSGGASLCIYGLLAIGVVWAPKNEISCWVLLLYRGLAFDVSVLTLGFWFIAKELLIAWLTGFRVSSEMVHLLGALLGFGVGTAFLKLGWVDCENWDLFAVWKGTYGKRSPQTDWRDNILVNYSPDLRESDAMPPAKIKKKKFRPSIYQSAKPAPQAAGPSTSPGEASEFPAGPAARRSMSESALPPATLKVLDRMRELVRAGKPQAALSEYRKRLRIVDHWPLEADDLRALADGLSKRKMWDEAVPLLKEFIDRFPAQADVERIKLAAICCEILHRPRAALKLLDQVEADDLPNSVRDRIAHIRRTAEQLIAEGTLELDGQI